MDFLRPRNSNNVVKLQELEKQRQGFHTYISSVLSNARTAPSTVEKVDILLQGIKGWNGAWSADSNDLQNIEQWVEQVPQESMPQSESNDQELNVQLYVVAAKTKQEVSVAVQWL